MTVNSKKKNTNPKYVVKSCHSALPCPVCTWTSMDFMQPNCVHNCSQGQEQKVFPLEYLLRQLFTFGWSVSLWACQLLHST